MQSQSNSEVVKDHLSEDNNALSEEEQFEDCVDELDVETDEEFMNECELRLTADELDSRKLDALNFKENGNSLFRKKEYLEAEKMYTSALSVCPIRCSEERAILYSNRAAARHRLDSSKWKDKAIKDCGKAIKLNEKYTKPYLRRAVIYREMGGEHLDGALADFKKVLELEPSNKEASIAVYELQKEVDERNEKLKTEMLGKLKDLGNLVLKPFGLSTDNFQLQQNAESGGYSINFKQ
ncbi:tetratricopeptide repeat protein 1-like protein [Leptotrombidium deliense]|uniref:Tetratricopeptide repeat protein 1-like protein n=1 Tax=Leptotrombidium deliense TaxID=299467 RepID=A0A443S6T5_9ACAR|nr:tetratricopeptide repeat protein 1-like protein [Leptotrombidium deliense]